MESNGVESNGKLPVIIVTNWRLDIVLGRTYGICSIDAPKEFVECSFKRGFPFTNPTHARCALFSLVMGMEQVLCSNRLCCGKFIVAVVTKSKSVRDLVIGDRASSVRVWANNSWKKPLRIAGYSKQFMRDVYTKLDTLRANKIGDVVYIEDNSNENVNMLTEHKVHLDIDPETDYGKDTGDKDEIKTSDAKHRNVLRQELMETSGARGSRMTRRLTHQQKLKIAQQEGHSTKKKKEDQTEKTTNAKRHTPDTKQISHSGLAAALAAEECRTTTNGTTTATGCGRITATGNCIGDVEEPEHGTDRGDRPAQTGVGKCETTIVNDTEHIVKLKHSDACP